MQQIDVTQAQTLLPQLLDAALKGEEVVITRDNQPLVRLEPLEQQQQSASADEGELKFGSARGLMVIQENFDDPIEELEEYM